MSGWEENIKHRPPSKRPPWKSKHPQIKEIDGIWYIQTRDYKAADIVWSSGEYWVKADEKTIEVERLRIKMSQ
jgi:hypothetical protein